MACVGDTLPQALKQSTHTLLNLKMKNSIHLVLLLLTLSTFTLAFPSDFDEDDNFFSERRTHRKHRKHVASSSNDEDDEDDRPAMYMPTKSQNRKFLARSPAHDKHFEKILRQQEQATIKSPKQALMVASDESRMKNRLRNALQTSDDDIYEVESAPVMKSTPYHSPSPKRRRPMSYNKQNDDEEMVFPISVGFESDEGGDSYESKPRSRARHGMGASSRYNVEQSHYQPPGKSNSGRPSSLHMSLGLSNDDSPSSKSSAYPRKASPSTPASSTIYHHQYHQGYSQVPAPITPANPYMQQQRQQLYATSPYNPSAYGYDGTTSLTPATTMVSASGVPMDASSLYATTRTHPMESAWLDMGAYSSGKGAFGWYSDVPVGL